MPTYVKTDYVPGDCDYITAGKEYKIEELSASCSGGWSEDDRGNIMFCLFEYCAHLNGRQWTVINRP